MVSSQFANRAIFWQMGLFFALGLAFAVPYIIKRSDSLLLVVPLVLAAAAGALACARDAKARSVPSRRIIAAGFVAALLIAYTSAAIWPNSGDEYGYLYAARTILAGRVYNPAPPVPELFDFSWIGIRDGRMASQYAPGWPVVLAPFLLAGLAPLANPVLLVALGVLLRACLNRIGTNGSAKTALLALVILAPFTLFNAASFFNHILTAVAVLGACWLALRDEQQPRLWSRLGIGAFLSLALVTRVEVGVITSAALAIDYLLRLRMRAFSTLLPIAVGGLPLSLLFLAYTAAITGSPFVSTQAWVAPKELRFGLPSPGLLLLRQYVYFAGLLAFTSVPLIALYGAALWTRLRARTARFYDLLLPALALFFVFYPADGGHQYGPRYWFAAWPLIALTIGSAAEGGFAGLGKRRIHLPTLAWLQAAGYLGFSLAFAVYLRTYIDARRAVYVAQPPETPAIVLIPNRKLVLTRLQPDPYYANADDFTRNDLNLGNEVLYGRGDDPTIAHFACALPGRHVYMWQEPGILRPIPCQ